MIKKIMIILIAAIFTTSFVTASYGQRSSGADLIRSGLLGAGAGAIGGAASGADSDELWKGALAGAGVNIIGGLLLDAITNGNTREEETYYEPAPTYTYVQPAPQYQAPVTVVPSSVTTVPVQVQQEDPYTMGFKAGYLAGYKAGYADGYNRDVRY